MDAKLCSGIDGLPGVLGGPAGAGDRGSGAAARGSEFKRGRDDLANKIAAARLARFPHLPAPLLQMSP